MYRLIEDLPINWMDLAQAELKSLGQVWLERKDQLAMREALEAFTRRLRREWAIETGIIERLYTWDRGVTKVLLEQGIEASLIAHQSGLHREEAERVTAIILDQESIIEGLFDFVKGQIPLTEHYIRSMHAQFTQHQDFVLARNAGRKAISGAITKRRIQAAPKQP